MDLDPQEIITALPETSILKIALTSIGTNADAMQPTEELFLFIQAYEETQTTFNAGTAPQTISTVRPPTFDIPIFDSNGNLTRIVNRQLNFKESYQVDSVDPIIVI